MTIFISFANANKSQRPSWYFIRIVTLWFIIQIDCKTVATTLAFKRLIWLPRLFKKDKTANTVEQDIYINNGD